MVKCIIVIENYLERVDSSQSKFDVWSTSVEPDVNVDVSADVCASSTTVELDVV